MSPTLRTVITEPVTDAEAAQMKQWYADGVRNLPRKVVADVARLLSDRDRLKAEYDAYKVHVVDKLHFAMKGICDSESPEAAMTRRAETAEARVAQLESELAIAKCKHINWHDSHHAGRLCDDCPAELDPTTGEAL